MTNQPAYKNVFETSSDTVALHVLISPELRRDLRIAAAEQSVTMKNLVEQLLRDGIDGLPKIE